MNFYRGNEIYNFISNVNRYRFPNDNFWFLVYGEKNGCQPKLLIALSGYEEKEFKNKTLKLNEMELIEYIKQISRRADVPWIYVRFNVADKNMNEVMFMAKNKRLSLINIEFYKNILEYFGLNLIDKDSQTKDFNTGGPSNIYQIWQMKISDTMISSDIDLFKIDADNEITDVYELKRSKIDIEKWEPFKADYHNFQLLNNLLIKANIKFHIVYNEYTVIDKNRKDNIKKVKLFNVEPSKDFKYEEPTIVSINDFFANY